MASKKKTGSKAPMTLRGTDDAAASTGLSTGAKVAIGTGVVAVAAAAAWYFFFRTPAPTASTTSGTASGAATSAGT